MNKFSRIISFILILSLSIVMLSGCSIPEKEVYDAIVKSQSITSMEQVMNIKWNVEASGFSKEDQEEINQTLPLINSSDLSLTQKVVSNKDATQMKSHTNVLLNFAGSLTNFGVWIDSDITEDSFEFKEIVQIPPIVAYSLPEEYIGKEYAYVDINTIDTLMGAEDLSTDDFQQSLEMKDEILQHFNQFMINYMKEFNFSKELITYKGTESLNNETVKVFELKLDDQTSKDLLQYTFITLLNSNATDEFLEEYINTVNEMMRSMGVEEEISQEEFLSELDMNKEEILSEINLLFAELQDIQILGEEGMTIELRINKEGYIVGTSTHIHLTIDTASLNDFSYEIEQPIYNIKLTIDTENKNINNELVIDLPVLTEENSFDLIEMLMTDIPPYTEEFYDDSLSESEIY